MLKFPCSPQATYSTDSLALLFRKIFPNVWPNSSYLKCRHTPPHPHNSGCVTWLCSLQMAAVRPSDHSLLCLFRQVLFLVLSQALFSLLCSLSHQSNSFPSNSIQTLLSAENQLCLLVLNRLQGWLYVWKQYSSLYLLVVKSSIFSPYYDTYQLSFNLWSVHNPALFSPNSCLKISQVEENYLNYIIFNKK